MFDTRICPKYKNCPKEFKDKCCCSVVHEEGCIEEYCEHFPKEKIVCRLATKDELMLSQF
jgi:hypothetical protein